ncbi:transferase hexapeptide domain protein [Ophiocordyceps camponoti-floridani]|uniref:Dynactin subunit 6 n=1 Tax=Ophiocordyceps camponoti-floridani TaxID=2030778 RepID=A0A8H4VHI3_9HYPO|nr:transferase hexapeptide domain protein [Ophiocordyceps camponoti-floridani]
MSSKRHSILPAIDRSGPKPPVKFASSLIISDNAILQGTHPILLETQTVIHPRARVESTVGSVVVGRCCIIQERALLGARPADSRDGGVVLGDYVVIEVGCIIEAGETEIGDGTTVHVGSRIGSGAKVGKHCNISHMSTIPPGEVLPDYTTVYSNGLRRIDRSGIEELRKVALLKETAVLSKLIASNPDKFV